MKKTKKRIRVIEYPAYPNAASRAYYRGKLLDVITAIVSGMGLLTVFLFFLTLS